MNVYRLEYTCGRVQVTQQIIVYFRAASDAAAVTEANRILGDDNCTKTNEMLFLVGVSVSLE